VRTKRGLIALGTAVLGAWAFSPSTGAQEDASGLWTVGRDGSKQRIATADGDEDFSGGASWSRDGARVAFVRGSRLVAREIAGAQTETTIATASSGTFLAEPAWSPTADRIAFVAGSEDEDGPAELRTSSPSGASVRRIVKASGLEHVRWSPDGRRLLFEGDYEVRCRSRGRSFTASTTAIFVVSSAGGGKKRVTTPSPCNRHREISDSSPEWITRTRFTFIRNAGDQPEDVPLESRLYAADVRNDKLRRLTVPIKRWDGRFADLDVSSDGRLIAMLFETFTVLREEGAVVAGDSQLWVVPVNGSAPRRLKLRTEKDVDGDVGGPVFAPDGQIAVCEDASSSVTLINPTNAKRRRLASFETCIPFAWSPDGDRLVVSVEDLVR
jgi:Tol biopolymer transport system component